jgi:hypothetical protein
VADAGAEQAIINAITLKNIMDAVEDLRADVGSIKTSIGYEGQDEHGKPIGVGVIGRLMRLEMKAYRISDKAIAFGAAMSICLLIVWWLVGDRMAELFK